MNAENKKGTLTNAVPCERGRRGRQDIIMGILKIAEYGSTRGKMIDKLNLSSAQCNRYLIDLKEAGCIAETGRFGKQPRKGYKLLMPAKSVTIS